MGISAVFGASQRPLTCSLDSSERPAPNLHLIFLVNRCCSIRTLDGLGSFIESIKLESAIVNSPSNIRWTNKSVLSFAGAANPIDAIERKAREVVFQAREAGWSGPPFNPVFIAKLMDVPTEANTNIADARTIFSPDGACIEYNPRQVRERVRFSVAHEIAHLLFPDASERIRNRGGTSEISDDWQLELLCNLAASEFVMPAGSLSAIETVPSIEELMVERRKFDVSAEAFLIRVAKISQQPVTMFCASPVSEKYHKRHYRVDYFAPSITAPRISISGRKIPLNSIIHHCTAIGYTERSKENWIDGQCQLIECVGIPSYPGGDLPRVAGLIKFDSTRDDTHPIRFVHGNALDPRGTGNHIVCQMVNDRAGRWGGGIARRTAQKFPQAEQEFATWLVNQPLDERLGQTHFSSVFEGTVIASLLAQEGFGKSKFPRIRYRSLEKCLRTVARFALENDFTIHMPRIGTGAAGGNWEIVEEIIDECLVSKGLYITVYDLPPKRQQLDVIFQ